MYYGRTSKSLDDSAIDILKQAQSQLCKIKVRLFSPNIEDIDIDPLSIEQFVVGQAFEANMHDVVMVTLKLRIEEALLILSNYQDLQISFRFTHVQQHHYQTITEIPVEVRKFNVIIHNATDLLKEMQKSEVAASQNELGNANAVPSDIHSRTYDLQLELVDEKLLAFRNAPVTNLSQDSTVSDVMVGSALAAGLKSDQIEFLRPPENEKKMSFLPVPPMQTVNTLFDLLQQSYGNFQKGMGYYFTEDKLSIFSEFDTNPQSEKTLHLYKAPTQFYGGNHGYHYEDESGDIHILLMDDVAIQNLAESSVDKTGNYQVSRRSDAGMDVDIVQQGKDVMVRGNNLMTMTSQNENVSRSGTVNTRYTPTTNNALAMSSEMASQMCKAMSAQWRMAWPWTLQPGMKIVYHYEEMGGMKTTTGILSSVSYALSKIDGTIRDHLSYAWAAGLQVRLSPDEDDEQKLTLDDLPALKQT